MIRTSKLTVTGIAARYFCWHKMFCIYCNFKNGLNYDMMILMMINSMVTGTHNTSGSNPENNSSSE